MTNFEIGKVYNLDPSTCKSARFVAVDMSVFDQYELPGVAFNFYNAICCIYLGKRFNFGHGKNFLIFFYDNKQIGIHEDWFVSKFGLKATLVC